MGSFWAACAYGLMCPNFFLLTAGNNNKIKQKTLEK